jgi:hypothetical protein
MKKIISIFLLIMISIQCLPVKELGKCIFESSFVEDDVCSNLEKKEIKDFSKEFFSVEFNIASIISTPVVYYNHNTDLYKNPFADLSIQPPNA